MIYRPAKFIPTHVEPERLRRHIKLELAMLITEQSVSSNPERRWEQASHDDRMWNLKSIEANDRIAIACDQIMEAIQAVRRREGFQAPCRCECVKVP